MLKALTRLYSCLTGLERVFFRFLPFLVFRPRARVIAIGNLTTGGTGKTPILFEILQELDNRHCCVLTRGYRSPWERSFYHLMGQGPHPEAMTDEALLLNARFPGVPIMVGKNRHHAAKMAELMYAPDLMLLDDGFQYRRLAKDVCLVLWDALADHGEAQLIPLGRMREPARRLNDATAILLTRCESAGAEKILFWKSWLARQAPHKPIIAVKTVCAGLFDQSEQPFTTADIDSGCLAFCAIGRPASFYKQLESLGITLSKTLEFRDHHRFTADDLQKIAITAQAENLRIVCTEKDACKIPAAAAAKMKLLTLRIRTVPVSGRSFSAELADHGIFL